MISILSSFPRIIAQTSGGGSNGGGSYGYDYNDYSSDSGTGGNCDKDCGIIMGSVFGGILFVVILCSIIGCLWKNHYRFNTIQKENLDFVNTGNPNNITVIPRGLRKWIGHYEGTSVLNSGRHNMSMHLNFLEDKNIEGSGRDGIGNFKIEGYFNALHGRIAFIKKYNSDGPVIYQGTFNDEEINGSWKLIDIVDSGTFKIKIEWEPPIEPVPVRESNVNLAQDLVELPAYHTISILPVKVV
jgi:hypothetical protein